MIRKTLQIIFLLATPVFLSGQDTDYFDNSYLRYNNHIYKDSIKTPLTFRSGFEMGYPFAELNSTDTIAFTFDELGNEIGDYYFTVIHCNTNWQPSSLSPMDYIDGYVENSVKEYNYSFNTFAHYIHYRIAIPNEDIRLKASGNYLLLVYANGNKEDLILTRRFYIVETKTEITPVVKRATQIDLMKTHHEVDFTLKNAFTCADPYNDIKVVISQNGRSDNQVTGLKPLFVKDNELVYDFEDGNLFAAGSEYRWADIKSTRYLSERLAKIDYIKPYFHFYLQPDEARTFKIYFQWQDINGKFLIKNSDGRNSNIEADYVFVHFSLPWDAPFTNGNVYVCGKFCNWDFSKENQMTYNYEKKSYELVLQLKQGFYDYAYAFLQDGATEADYSLVEGNHYEADNDYIIHIYWHDITSRYDKLVGIKTVNSRTNR